MEGNVNRNFFFLVLFIFCMIFAFGCGPEDKYIQQLDSPDPAVRLQAVKDLTELGTLRALNELTMRQDDKDDLVREAIRNGIKKISAQTFYK